MKNAWIALAAAGALGLATLGGVAVAQQGPGGGEGRGWGHHGGGYGMMRGEGGWRGEGREGREGRWGGGNPEQRMQRAERMLQFGFDQFDRNLDGVIEWSEAKLVLERRFERFDTNSDGAITRADVEARMPQPPGGGPGGGQGPNAEQRQQRRAEMMNRIVERFMGRFGKPADGRVTKEEFVAQFEPVFKAMNRTNDGRLTRPQVEEFFVFMRMLRG